MNERDACVEALLTLAQRSAFAPDRGLGSGRAQASLCAAAAWAADGAVRALRAYEDAAAAPAVDAWTVWHAGRPYSGGG